MGNTDTTTTLRPVFDRRGMLRISIKTALGTMLLVGFWVQLPRWVGERFHYLLRNGRLSDAAFYSDNADVIESETYRGLYVQTGHGHATTLVPEDISNSRLQFAPPTLFEFISCRRRFEIIQTESVFGRTGIFQVKLFRVEYRDRGNEEDF